MKEETNLNDEPVRQPAINAPMVILIGVAVLTAIHLAQSFMGAAMKQDFVLSFAFTPARFDPPPELQGVRWPGGEGAKLWTFFTHSLLHGSWAHLIINCIWMLAFGSVVARRIGALRFILLSMLAAAAGAAANLMLSWGQFSVLVGASGAISGQMAAAVRLMFATPGALGQSIRADLSAVRALSLTETLTNSRALMFLAIWLGVTLVFGATGIGTSAEISRIAWEAHIGGFVAGLFLFGVFDPVKTERN